MSTQPTPKSASAGSDSSDSPRPVPESDPALRRRKLLRLAAGGVPLLATSPVSAKLAASSAMRGARNDAKRRPPMVTKTPHDGWIRAKIEVVKVRVKDSPGQPGDGKPGQPQKPWDAGYSSSSFGGGYGGNGGSGGNGGNGSNGGNGGAGHQGPTIDAYKFGSPPRYYQIKNMWEISSLHVEEVEKVGPVYSLVLFNHDGTIHGVDPRKKLGGGLQGLHYSSWKSISPNGKVPGYHTGV